ncbi:MAG: type I restriction enzyme HsdR N-terminal domain-containing protein [Candidatus Magnetomorum sp.]|nr:type I restriction enzyme HsdR N-terminal domain-containing protein [Candidatus Magnetomorum sp.]
MKDICQKPYDMLVDYITGNEIPNVGAEENRQAVERYLVDQKNYDRSTIELNKPIDLQIGIDRYQSQIDMLVQINGQSVMVIKCAAGSLGSREREAIAAARLLETNQIPLSVVSDGQTALIRDVITGKKFGEGLDAIPSMDEAIRLLEHYTPEPLPENRMEREKLVFRTYDSMNINVQRNIK